MFWEKCYNFPDTQWQKKKVVQWSKAKINPIFTVAIMDKRFHQLSFYLIKISQVLTELLIWIVFCYCDILMPKLGPFPPAKASRLWSVSTQIYYIACIITKKNFMALFYRWGSTASRLVPLRGSSLLFTAKFPDIPGTHFIGLGRMIGWVDLGGDFSGSLGTFQEVFLITLFLFANLKQMSAFYSWTVSSLQIGYI